MNFKFKLSIFLGITLLLIGVGFNRSYQDTRSVPVHFSVACIHFYKKNIATAGAPTCRFYPTCSKYSQEALEKYGLMKGWAMSFDRLTRCNDEEWIYPDILVEDELKKYDPVPSQVRSHILESFEPSL